MSVKLLFVSIQIIWKRSHTQKILNVAITLRITEIPRRRIANMGIHSLGTILSWHHGMVSRYEYVGHVGKIKGKEPIAEEK